MNDVPVKDEMTMEELLNEASAQESRAGGVVTAHVVGSAPSGLLVDVGLKVEGFIPLSEFAALPHPPAVGETFPAVVKRMKGPDGHPLVSWREAKDRAHRGHVLQAKEARTPLEGTVVRQVKGGLIVDIGVEGFLPASQVDRRPVKDLKAFVGRKIPVLVIEMDEKGGVVLSRRQVLEREAAAKQAETLKSIEVGKVTTGTVTSLTGFGAFVDIGGVEGLLRVADVAWGRVEKLSDHLAVGRTIEVKVLKYDAAARKIALGRKQLLPHPWEGIEKRFPPNAVVKGRVTSLTTFGAFVELEPGVEGLVHQSEFSWKERWAKPDQFLKAGEETEVAVISIDRKSEKIALSLKRARENPWQEAARLYKKGTRVKGAVTHMVPFGAFVRLPIGVEGLLRTADISWTKPVHHPKDWLKEGEEREFVVLEVVPAQERVSLGLKQLTEDPFTRYKPGAVVEGKVVRFTDFGAIVEIAPDVEGFVHVSEIPLPPRPNASENAAPSRLEHPSEALTLEQKVTATVMKVQPKSKRIDLSIRKYDVQQERKLIKKYSGGGGSVTLGDVTEWEEFKNNPAEPS